MNQSSNLQIKFSWKNTTKYVPKNPIVFRIQQKPVKMNINSEINPSRWLMQIYLTPDPLLFRPKFRIRTGHMNWKAAYFEPAE